MVGLRQNCYAAAKYGGIMLSVNDRWVSMNDLDELANALNSDAGTAPESGGDLDDIANVLGKGQRQTGQCRCHPRVRSAGPFCPRCGGHVPKRLLTPTALAWTVGAIAALAALFVGIAIGTSDTPADAPGRLADLQAQFDDLQNRNTTLSAKLTQSESRLAAATSAEDTLSANLATSQVALAQEQGRTAALSRELTAAKTAAENSAALRSQLDDTEKDRAEARNLRNRLAQTEASLAEQRAAFEEERDKLAAELALARGTVTGNKTGTNSPTTRPAGKAVLAQQPANGNSLVMEAAMLYDKVINDSYLSKTTTALKQLDQIAARKQFDESLAKGPLSFTASVNDVVVSGNLILVTMDNYPVLTTARTVRPVRPADTSATIHFYQIRIIGTAEDAAKITTYSKVLLTGVLTATASSNIRLANHRARVLGEVETSHQLRMDLIFRDDPVVEIDGVKRQLLADW
jgi:hypothetical protein